MTDWTAPHAGTFHHDVGREPHSIESCGDWCAGVGWKGWAAKDAVVDIDDDPRADPGRSGKSG